GRVLPGGQSLRCQGLAPHRSEGAAGCHGGRKGDEGLGDEMMEENIEPLAETLTLLPFEPATSHVSRLAAMNGAGNARQFCWDHYLRFDRIVAGDPREIARY